MRLPHVLSEILAGAAEAEAIKISVPMAIAIVDGEGGLQYFKRMDGTLPVSTELAISKAYTAAAIRIPTDEVGRLAQPGEALYGIQHTHNGRIVLFGGGYPLCIEGQVMGAIGISGGTVEQDMAVAEPVVQLLKDAECWAHELRAFVPEHVASASALPELKEKLLRIFANGDSAVPNQAAVALTGGVLLAVT